MAVLVTDAGMVPDDWHEGFMPLGGQGRALDLPSAALTRDQRAWLEQALPGLALIRLGLRHFGDTAALDLARALRGLGFRGRLRAHGAVLARSYTLLRRAGFDEVELDNDQARLQPPEHWHNETGWQPRPLTAAHHPG